MKWFYQKNPNSTLEGKFKVLFTYTWNPIYLKDISHLKTKLLYIDNVIYNLKNKNDIFFTFLCTICSTILK